MSTSPPTPPRRAAPPICSGFELGGYVNLALFHKMVVTYVLSRGELYITPR